MKEMNFNNEIMEQKSRENFELNNQSESGENILERILEERETAEHSSDHYREEMEKAEARGDLEGYTKAQKLYGQALAREKNAEADEDSKKVTKDGRNVSFGYSSDYYANKAKQEAKNGNKIAANNAWNSYSQSKAKETLGTSSGKNVHKLASGIKSGNSIEINNAINSHNSEVKKTGKK